MTAYLGTLALLCLFVTGYVIGGLGYFIALAMAKTAGVVVTLWVLVRLYEHWRYDAPLPGFED